MTAAPRPPGSLPWYCRALLALVVSLAAPTAGAEPMALDAAPILLNPDDPSVERLGPLTWLGGVRLDAADPRFGGYSGLEVLPDGRLLAISDLGHWLSFRPVRDGRGRLTGAAAADLSPLPDRRGRPLADKHDSDAEALRRLADGSLLVSFERRHRLWRYPATDAPAVEVPAPANLRELPENGGIEALAVLPDDGRLLIAENGRRTQEFLRAWLQRNGRWHELAYVPTGLFRPTDAAALSNGDVLVLERRFTLVAGVAARLARIPAAQIVPGGRLDPVPLAELVPPYSVDNMEGLAVVPEADGSALVYLISDDNRNPLQRTLLMLFRLNPAPAASR